MKMFRRKDEGLTLVELMVVILIIGILVAIAIPVFNAARATAERRTCHANQRTIEGAAQQYVADVGGDISAVDAMGLLVPQFIAVTPQCPTAGAPAYTITDGVVAPCGAGTPAHGDYN